jgi:hypothetical protein
MHITEVTVSQKIIVNLFLIAVFYNLFKIKLGGLPGGLIDTLAAQIPTFITLSRIIP